MLTWGLYEKALCLISVAISFLKNASLPGLYGHIHMVAYKIVPYKTLV